MWQLTISLFFLSILFFSGCTKEIRESRGETISLMLDWAPSPTHIPLYYGVRKGFFEAEGIDLNIVKKGECDPVHLLHTQSNIDLVISYLPRIMRIQAAFGPTVNVIGSLIETPLNGFLGLSDHISSVQEINRKKIGFSSSKFSSSTLDTLLSFSHIAICEKLNVRMDLLPQLILGNVDLIWGAFRSIESNQIEAFGKKANFFGVEAFGMPPYHELVIVSVTKGALVQKQMVAAFQRALQKSIDEALKNPDEALQGYFLSLPEKGAKCRAWEEKSWYELMNSFSKNQNISSQEIESLYIWLQENGLIVSSIDLEQLFKYVSTEKPSYCVMDER